LIETIDFGQDNPFSRYFTLNLQQDPITFGQNSTSVHILIIVDLSNCIDRYVYKS